jgi:hypothetical protein
MEQEEPRGKKRKGDGKVKSNKVETEKSTELKKRNADHKKTVEDAMQRNIAQGSRGEVRVGKLPFFRGRSGDKTWPLIPGFKNVNVCSGAAGIYKELSPMKLGPICISDNWTCGKINVKNIENLWQYSKVWPGEEIEDFPTTEFFERRKRGWADIKGHRHVKKGTGSNPNIPLYSFWKGEKLSYVEARKRIYCPIYSQLVVNTTAYRRLDNLLDKGYNIQILGYDGYDFINEGKTLKMCVDDASRPFGHELVLAALLRNEEEGLWDDVEEIEESSDSSQSNSEN